MKALIIVVVIAALIGVYALLAGAFGGSPPPAPPPAATEAPEPEPPADPSEALEGRTWLLLNTLPDTEITVAFVRGKVSGSAGCNKFTGNYQTSSDATMRISDLAGGRMACDQPIMDQETNFLTALGSATSFQVQDDQLTLHTGSGALQFRAK
ncbi:MAG: META domain-containing protein [Chloroflexi bacterium]|nr:META domain-containing protein [Chloroflexota bacterium]